MKKFIKNNSLILISITILVLWYLFSLSNFLVNFNASKENEYKYYENKCNLDNTISEKCDNLEKIKDYDVPPAPLLYSYIIGASMDSIMYLPIITVLFVSIPAIYNFYRETKSGFYKNKLTREKYFNFFYGHYKKSLKCLLILPIFLLITFFITCIISKFRFQDITFSNFFTTKEYAKSLWIPYFLTILFNILYHSLFYINTAYIAFYKAKNFAINIVLTYLFYLLSQIVIVRLIGMFFGRVLKMGEFAMSMEDPIIWGFGADVPHFEYMIISSILYAFISTLIVFLFYRKKERFVIANE